MRADYQSCAKQYAESCGDIYMRELTQTFTYELFRPDKGKQDAQKQ